MALAQRAMRPCSLKPQNLTPHSISRAMSSARRCLHNSPSGQRQNQLMSVPLRPLGYGQVLGLSMQMQRQQIVARSFLGVGAPEAILVAVVALVVFGPKGLADAAKSLGQTLRAFQPTIREVVEVSQEIKGTLEQELGLDEIRQAATMRPTPRPMPTASTSSADDAAATGSATTATSTSGSNLQPITEDQARQLDPEIELKRAMSEQVAWGGQPPAASAAPTAAPAAVATAAAVAAGSGAAAAAPAKDLSTLSLEELEAELAKRKSSSA